MNEEEKQVLMDHEYDGIQEFDFALPRWWLATFWGGIIFAIIYIVYYIFLNGPSLQHEYYVDKAQVDKVRKEYMKALQKFDPEKLATFSSGEHARLYGQTIFAENCQACHNKNGAGDIGPNLTDKNWLYTEGTSQGLFQFIIEGNPTGGMPAWGIILSKDDLYAVTAYINSLKGMKHIDPPPKEPEGEEYP